MNEAYREWYKWIGDNASNEAIGIEAVVEIEIRVWSMQQHKNLLYLIRELELDK